MRTKETMSKHGLTLIELLAIIIILSVILLIAIPAVSETVANNIYKVYSITISPSTMKSILKDSILKDISLKNNVSGEVWINKDGYVYKIIYNVNTGMEDTSKSLTVNASYFRVNNISEIKGQITIK